MHGVSPIPDSGHRAAQDLGKAMQQALSVPFDILGARGVVFGTGVVGGAAVEVPAGPVTLRFRGGGFEERAAIVKPDEETLLAP